MAVMPPPQTPQWMRPVSRWRARRCFQNSLFALVLGLGLAGALPLAALTGPAEQELSTLLIVAIAVSVTSIPVISRIFWDLGSCTRAS